MVTQLFSLEGISRYPHFLETNSSFLFLLWFVVCQNYIIFFYYVPYNRTLTCLGFHRSLSSGVQEGNGNAQVSELEVNQPSWFLVSMLTVKCSSVL